MKKLPKLYSRTSTGKVQEWQICVDGNKYFTIEGIKDGKLTETKPTVCEGKNIGRSNETSPEEQALKDAQSKWQKKVDKGYFEDISKIDNETFIEPMLAKSYDDHKDDFDEETFKQGVFVQPKLDGIRCVISKKGMFSRNGKEIMSAPHIFEAVKEIVNKGYILDGELYNHDFKEDFNAIVSLSRRTKPTAEELAESKKYLEYHCYDLVDSTLDFAARSKDVSAICRSVDHVKIVKTIKCGSHEEINKTYCDFCEAGYEGQIIRLNTKYENKRTKALLKRKEFMDEEFVILDVVEGEGNRSGMAGYVFAKTKDGKHFKSNIKGSHEFLAQFLRDRKKIIGQKATIKFFNYTPDGIPRFGFVMAVRNYE